MADVATHSWGQVPFRRSPVDHAPSPVGFGFGLSATPTAASWASSPATHTPLSAWNIPLAHPQPYHVRPMKRRLETEDEDTRNKPSSDDGMDRSPTPERPRRGVPKRARTTPAVHNASKHTDSDKGKSPAQEENDVDVGVLLASLPPETLLPLLTSLISSQPSLKASVLALIPRPTLDTATRAVAKSAKKLLDAYPYSSSGSSSHGFADFGGSRSPGFGSTVSGFGSGRPFHAAHTPEAHHAAGMRNEYIISRLRPHIQEFVSACLSYLPYFSYINNSLDLEGAIHGHVHTRSHASALQSQHKDKSHPSETFLFLHALTTHIMSQPPLTQSLLISQLLPRLVQEWNAWVDRVDQVVNREGGMFGQEVVRSWERGLDEFSTAAEKEGSLHPLRDVRDRWVAKVGWLVGRQPMES